MRHVVVLSDIHLCENEPGDGLWMRYRQAPFTPDRELAAMLDTLRREVAGDELELVLNGDVFDFDAPRVLGGRSVFHDEPRDAAHTVPMIEAILDDNPLFVAALGRVIADGSAVVFVSGNHDLALGLPEVREALTARLVAAATRAGGGEPTALRARVLHRSWLHLTEDGVLVEHGNQYDAYCAVRHPMAPFARGAREVQPTLGSLAARHLVSRMGYFNPHVERSYMLSSVGYVLHFARYYLWSRHSIAFVWFFGALRAFATLCLRREPTSRERREVDVAAAARETGASPRALARHARLFARPAGDVLGRAARELYLDRLAVVIAALGVGLALAVLAHAPAALAGVAAVVALVLYELAIPKAPLETNWRRVRRAARAIARVHGARAVVLGHTHAPEGTWERGVFFGNSGSWSAAYADLACTKPVNEQRPLVWLRSAGARGALTGGLVAWKQGGFRPYERAAAALVTAPAEPAPATAVADLG
jgi:UDP-2,3-diacylglucosamine pyrophosphatase LpxH